VIYDVMAKAPPL